jgi:hypothetical protein
MEQPEGDEPEHDAHGRRHCECRGTAAMPTDTSAGALMLMPAPITTNPGTQSHQGRGSR